MKGILSKEILKYPHLRYELILTLTRLSDREYQEEVWVKKRYPTNMEYDSIDIAIDFLFDDTSFENDPEKMVGVMIYNQEEITLIKEVLDSLNLAMDNLGKANDEQYIHSKFWPIVISKAKKALDYIKMVDKEKEQYKKPEPCP